LRYCRTPNDAPVAPFLRSNRRIDSNYFRFKVKIGGYVLFVSASLKAEGSSSA
jgi:hypothetical protein